MSLVVAAAAACCCEAVEELYRLRAPPIKNAFSRVDGELVEAKDPEIARVPCAKRAGARDVGMMLCANCVIAPAQAAWRASPPRGMKVAVNFQACFPICVVDRIFLVKKVVNTRPEMIVYM